MPDLPTPEMLKRMKMDMSKGSSSADAEAESRASSSSSTAGPSKSRSATVEEVEDEDGDMRGVEEDFAPGGDADYFAEEDEEGRFYGGGLTQEQKEILNIFDKDVAEDVREDVSSLSSAVEFWLWTLMACVGSSKE